VRQPWRNLYSLVSDNLFKAAHWAANLAQADRVSTVLLVGENASWNFRNGVFSFIRLKVRREDLKL